MTTTHPPPPSLPQLPDLWRPDGAFARHIPGYEPRPNQAVMSQAVDDAIRHGQNLIVEAGTGIGKSLAYFAPAILAAVEDQRYQFAVSTNTINLQEQLVHKDLPQTEAALVDAGLLRPRQLIWTALKGRNNYLCSHQFEAAREQGDDEDGLLSLVSNWQTRTGDVAELSLTPLQRRRWSAISAQYAQQCPLYQSGDRNCYLNRARNKAKNAHIVIVNHALLLSDIAAHEPYLAHLNQVIIDEAHHLEEQASKQFGWEISHDEIAQHLNALASDPTLSDAAARTTQPCQHFWSALARLIDDRRPDDPVAVTPQLRRQPGWHTAQAAAQEMDEALGQLQDYLSLQTTHATRAGDAHREATLRPASIALSEFSAKVRELMDAHNPDTVQWISPRQDRNPTVHAVPLRIGPILQERLFKRRHTVILTSATLSSGHQDFDLLIEQVGFCRGDAISLQSPFHYPSQARFMSPSDLPNPKSFRDHAEASAHAIDAVCRELDGHTLALFTSNSALKDAAQRLRPGLRDAGIAVLAQNVDGAPADVIQAFRRDPRAVILGTNSFWEGIDLAPEHLHAVVICRLPFPVPTDPIIAARSRLYTDAFRQYHLPTAILRFRQGFGRLIRNHRSRGSVVVLDPRIRNKNYGRAFFNALPTCDYAKSTIHDVGNMARQWMETAPVATGVNSA